MAVSHGLGSPTELKQTNKKKQPQANKQTEKVKWVPVFIALCFLIAGAK